MKVLVTGVGGPAGQSVRMLLLEAGHSVLGTDMRLVEMVSRGEFQQSPAADDGQYIDWLMEMAQRVDYIIPTVQEELPVLAAVRTTLGCPVLIGERQPVEIAHDKFLTAQVLAQADVDVPEFSLPSALNLVNSRRLGWPRVSKPRMGREGRNVTVYDTPEEFSRAASLGDAYIVQEFMPGVEYSVNLFLCEDPHDAVLNTVAVLQKVCLRNGRTGNADAVQAVVAPDVAEVAVAAAQAIGLTGPIDMDVRRRRDGIPTVLEINARFGANIRHAPQVFDAALRLMGRLYVRLPLMNRFHRSIVVCC